MVYLWVFFFWWHSCCTASQVGECHDHR